MGECAQGVRPQAVEGAAAGPPLPRNRPLNQKLVIRANRIVRGNPGEMFVLLSASTK